MKIYKAFSILFFLLCSVFSSHAEASGFNELRGRIIEHQVFGPTIYTESNEVIQLKGGLILGSVPHQYPLGMRVVAVVTAYNTTGEIGISHYYPDFELYGPLDAFPFLTGILNSCVGSCIHRVEYRYAQDLPYISVLTDQGFEFYTVDGFGFVDDPGPNFGGAELVKSWTCDEIVAAGNSFGNQEFLNCYDPSYAANNQVVQFDEGNFSCGIVPAISGCGLEGALNYNAAVNFSQNEICQFTQVQDGMTVSPGETLLLGPFPFDDSNCNLSDLFIPLLSPFYIDPNGNERYLQNEVFFNDFTEVGFILEADESWCGGIDLGVLYTGVNNPCNEIISLNYSGPCSMDCQGVPGGSLGTGSSCDDQDPLTIDDVYDANCTCAGTLWSASNPCPINSSGQKVKVKLSLEGAFDGVSMSTQLLQMGLLPKLQPYGVAPFNYAGTEAVTSFPAGTVDWILVELRTSFDDTGIVDRRAALLRNDGMVLDLDGTAGVLFQNVSAGQSYVVTIRHRNHLTIGSGFFVQIPNEVVHDFSLSLSQSFGINQLQQIGGQYSMISGDLNGDSTINFLDFLAWFAENNLLNAYTPADLNLDGTVNFLDFILWFKNNNILGGL